MCAFGTDEELDDLIMELGLAEAKTEVGVVSGSSVANKLAKRIVAARAAKPRIVHSKSEGQVHEDTIDLVFKHALVTVSGNGVHMAGLRIKGHRILMPSHFVHQGQFQRVTRFA